MSRFKPNTGLFLSILPSCVNLLAGVKALSPCLPIIVIECSKSEKVITFEEAVSTKKKSHKDVQLYYEVQDNTLRSYKLTGANFEELCVTLQLVSVLC